MSDTTKNLFYLVLAVPLLYAFIGIEAWVALKKFGKKRTWQAFMQHVNISMGQQAFGAFFELGIAVVYTRIYSQHRLFDLNINAWTILLAFVMLDFNTYLFHRLSHRRHILWANHSVHHSGQEFGLAAGVRHPWFSAIILAVPQYSLALIGIRPQLFFPLITAFYLYQFFTHSDVIPRLGWIEKVFVTPSHHRVHHGSDEKYLDSNYGAVLIVWDRLFGTHVEEQEEPVYGLVQPTGITTAVWENVHYYLYLFRAVLSLPDFKTRFQLLFSPPAFRFEGELQERLDALKSEVIGNERAYKNLMPSLPTQLRIPAFITAYFMTLTYMGIHHSAPRMISGALALGILLLIALQPDVPEIPPATTLEAKLESEREPRGLMPGLCLGDLS
ncbi:MAG: sterol desaturase family protein [Methylotenera sp.]|nr:sterol desaturase family protein [Oligoflexia bacterium]